MKSALRLGISTCPNDTFAFHALLCGAVEVPGLTLEIELHDVEELNEALVAGRFDVAKGSFHAAFHLAPDLYLLSTGSALGFGNGPLVLAPKSPRPANATRRVLAPGRLTTAHLLFRMFHPEEEAAHIEQVVFSDIMPALEAGAADLGICIHEGRFTFAERCLMAIEDLGQRWQELTGLPLPLGGIFARRQLAPAHIRAVEDALRTSIEFGRAHPAEALVSMRRYAQEHTDEVLRAHVDLYVNEQTLSLDESGFAAVAALEEHAVRAGLIERRASKLELFRG